MRSPTISKTTTSCSSSSEGSFSRDQGRSTPGMLFPAPLGVVDISLPPRRRESVPAQWRGGLSSALAKHLGGSSISTPLRRGALSQVRDSFRNRSDETTSRATAFRAVGVVESLLWRGVLPQGCGKRVSRDGFTTSPQQRRFDDTERREDQPRKASFLPRSHENELSPPSLQSWRPRLRIRTLTEQQHERNQHKCS